MTTLILISSKTRGITLSNPGSMNKKYCMGINNVNKSQEMFGSLLQDLRLKINLFSFSGMAAKNNELDRTNIKFLQPLENRYICNRCKLVLRQPMQTECGHRFCKTCINDILTQ